MTNSEAIKILSRPFNMIGTSEEILEAHNMAVEALKEKRRQKMVETTELIGVAEDFNKWLDDMSEKYGWDKDDIRSLIK